MRIVVDLKIDVGNRQQAAGNQLGVPFRSQFLTINEGTIGTAQIMDQGYRTGQEYFAVVPADQIGFQLDIAVSKVVFVSVMVLVLGDEL